ncbi:MAG: 30S ribosomal protein S21 [Deltaproteobacteria bacterium]|nr:30S ribosomal protein S21 [Deltaproteobacteria bacterium]
MEIESMNKAVVHDLPVVQVMEGQFENALRYFRRRVGRAGIVRECKRHESFATARERRFRKELAAIQRKKKAMLRYKAQRPIEVTIR